MTLIMRSCRDNELSEPSIKQQAERIAKEPDEALSQVLRRALRAYGQEQAQLELPRPRGARRP